MTVGQRSGQLGTESARPRQAGCGERRDSPPNCATQSVANSPPQTSDNPNLPPHRFFSYAPLHSLTRDAGRGGLAIPERQPPENPRSPPRVFADNRSDEAASRRPTSYPQNTAQHSPAQTSTANGGQFPPASPRIRRHVLSVPTKACPPSLTPCRVLSVERDLHSLPSRSAAGPSRAC